MSDPIYKLVNGIKIYDGTTKQSQIEHKEKIKHLKKLIKNKPQIFTPLKPSTLTAQGKMSNVDFLEKILIQMIAEPTGNILMIGCNYGELFNKTYKKPIIKKPSGRGRKPKPKRKTKRKIQGNGRYFSSQVTFVIRHPKTQHIYKIKLFRNGVFQVPGIKDPTMIDLVEPIDILKKYLSENLHESIQVVSLIAVMRNYKSQLINPNFHVHLEKLEELILKEKNQPSNEIFINYMLQSINKKAVGIIKKRIGNFNPMNIAEMTYNTDRCVCLIIKFYRPNILKPQKKTTVKLLKKGKINFDGGNSEQEILELYYWTQHIYHKYADKILFDVRHITNKYDTDTSECSDESIYD